MLVCDIKRGEGNYLMEVIPYGNGTDMSCHAAFFYHRYDLSHVTCLKKNWYSELYSCASPPDSEMYKLRLLFPLPVN